MTILRQFHMLSIQMINYFERNKWWIFQKLKINKGNSSILLFKSHKSIEKTTNPSYKLNLRRKKTSTIRENQRINQNTEIKKNKRHTETNYKITTAILRTWYRKLKKNCGLNLVLWLTKPCTFMAMILISLKWHH